MRTRSRRPWRWALLLALHAIAASAATIVVDTVEDVDADDGRCSLREAIVAANDDVAWRGCTAGSGSDLVVFGVATPATLLLDSPLPVVTASAAFAGPGSDRVTIDGQQSEPIFVLDSDGDDGEFELSDLTLARGDATGEFLVAGAVTVRAGDHVVLRRLVVLDNVADNAGGGLLLDSLAPLAASALVDRCRFEGNVSPGPAGGGGIYATNDSQLTVVDSTFFDNRAEAEFGSGGAMFVRNSEVAVARSTFSGNQANANGGGIAIAAGAAGLASVAIADSTITANLAEANGDTDGNGGGIFANNDLSGATLALSLANTLVAGNTDSGFQTHPDLSLLGTVALASLGTNLLGAAEGTAWSAGAPNASGDYVGTVVAPLDPRLQPLADAGGPTPVHLPAPHASSLTLDHGDCTLPAADQRGWRDPSNGARAVDLAPVPNGPASDGCDIGAAELGAAPPPGLLFEDGFESGTAFLWSAAVAS